VAPYFNEHGVIEQYVALHTEVTAPQEADASLRHVFMLKCQLLPFVDWCIPGSRLPSLFFVDT
jgi:hypothetical protein